MSDAGAQLPPPDSLLTGACDGSVEAHQGDVVVVLAWLVVVRVGGHLLHSVVLHAVSACLPTVRLWAGEGRSVHKLRNVGTNDWDRLEGRVAVLKLSFNP